MSENIRDTKSLPRRVLSFSEFSWRENHCYLRCENPGRPRISAARVPSLVRQGRPGAETRKGKSIATAPCLPTGPLNREEHESPASFSTALGGPARKGWKAGIFRK